MSEADGTTKKPIPIGAGWMPDLTPSDMLKKGGLRIAKNVLPIAEQYVSLNEQQQYNTNAMSGTPLSGVMVQHSDGIFYNFAGTTTKLYRFTKSAMTDVSKVATTYNASAWSFAEYGTWLIATNGLDNVQVLKGITVANFVDLGGTPPKAKYCILNHGHLIFANLDPGGTNYPKKLKWSSLENPESYTGNGADEQELPEMLGIITGIANVGDKVAIFAENSITIGFYVGGAYTFNFRINALKGVGCYYPNSLVNIHNGVLFWGKDNIYLYLESGELKPVGNVLREAVLENVHSDYANKISAAHDKENGLVIWAYPDASSTGMPNRLLAFNYNEGRFTHSDISASMIMTAATGGISIDELTTSSIDASTISIDSNFWLGKAIQPVAISSSGYVSTFSGAPQECEIESGEVSNLPVYYHISKVYSPIELGLGSGAITINHRSSSIDGFTAATPATIKSDGSADTRTCNRRFTVTIKATGYNTIGNLVEAEVAPEGEQ